MMQNKKVVKKLKTKQKIATSKFSKLAKFSKQKNSRDVAKLLGCVSRRKAGQE